MQTDQWWAIDTFIFSQSSQLLTFWGVSDDPGCFIIKFGYNARCHWLTERALSEYKAQNRHAMCQIVLSSTISRTSL